MVALKELLSLHW